MVVDVFYLISCVGEGWTALTAQMRKIVVRSSLVSFVTEIINYNVNDNGVSITNALKEFVLHDFAALQYAK